MGWFPNSQKINWDAEVSSRDAIITSPRLGGSARAVGNLGMILAVCLVICLAGLVGLWVLLSALALA